MIVKRVKVSAQDIKDFIQASPLVTEVQAFDDGDIYSIRIESRDERQIVMSVSSVRELVKVEEAE